MIAQRLRDRRIVQTQLLSDVLDRYLPGVHSILHHTCDITLEISNNTQFVKRFPLATITPHTKPLQGYLAGPQRQVWATPCGCPRQAHGPAPATTPSRTGPTWPSRPRLGVKEEASAPAEAAIHSPPGAGVPPLNPPTNRILMTTHPRGRGCHMTLLLPANRCKPVRSDAVRRSALCPHGHTTNPTSIAFSVCPRRSLRVYWGRNNRKSRRMGNLLPMRINLT
jgi:hypothetical protein